MMTVEFAFQRAWRDWRLASKFKNVHFSVQRNDLLRILDRSERRRGPIVAAWSNGEMLVPYLTMDGWTIEDAADIVLGTCGVSLAGWTELSRGFVAGLGERNFEMSTSR